MHKQWYAGFPFFLCPFDTDHEGSGTPVASRAAQQTLPGPSVEPAVPREECGCAGK